MSSPLRDRNFVLFWILQAVSVAGDSLTTLAVPLLVLQLTDSVFQMGLVTAAIGGAWLVSGVLAGSIVDRFDRRTVMIACDVARAGLYGLVPLVWLVEPHIWVLYAAMPLGAAAGMLYQVGYITAVPALVGKEQITRANGLLSASFAVAGITGPAIGAALFLAVDPAWVIGIDAVTFGLSAVAMSFVRLRQRESAGAAESPIRGFVTGLRFLWGHPVLRTITLLLCGVLFLTYAMDDLLIYRLRGDLGQGGEAVGVVFAIGAAGSVLAGAVVAALRRRLGFGACWIGAYVLTAIALAGAGSATVVPVLAGCLAVILFCQGIAGTCSMSLRQEITPDHLLGRVTSAFWTIHYLPGPLGAPLVTFAASRAGVPAVTLALGLGLVVIAVVAAFSPLRTRAPERLAFGDRPAHGEAL
ncbi:MFS transporter [Asanoa sp. WMMD1127]|uniref:MFS transporter n=1 Tax=Asanoa sp. WMMD1127 TaxID=3016107 RepID=UPI00241808F9|nr:MFS transporter [Asanoa sp. WMMD1127]MDG4822656.1 MFS transporter [Asanoa sp. WMMD1127]